MFEAESVRKVCSLIDEYAACRDITSLEEQLTYLCFLLKDSDLPYVVEWLCNWLEKLCLLDDNVMLLAFEKGLCKISSSCDCDECLLLLQNYLSTSKNVGCFIRILKPVSLCAAKVGLKYFGRTREVFLSCEKLVNRLSGNELFSALSASSDFFCNFITPNSITLLNSADRSFLQHHTLYMVSMLIYINSDDSKKLLLPFTRNLSVVCEGLYTLCLSSCKLLFTSPDLVLYGRTVASCVVPGWLQLLHYFLIDHTDELCKFWPLIFTHEYGIDLLCPFVCFLLDTSRRKLLLGISKNYCPDSTQQSLCNDRYIVLRRFAIDFIRNLFKKYRCSLHLTWWNPRRFSLLDALEAVAVEPVSAETLPNYITEAISCIEQLLSSSTHLARFHIYARFLEPTKDKVHHGWRGHVITLFKNHLHEVILMHTDDSKEQFGVSNSENSVDVCYSDEVGCIFRSIFQYPLPFNPQEDITDESGWLLSALNLAMYVFIRFKSCPSPPISHIVEFLTNTSDGKMSYFSEFMCSLKSCLKNRIAQCQAHISTLHATLCNADNAIETNRLTSELNVQENIMLRLRLLEMTLRQTETVHLQSKPTDYA
ncbi:hypothetical protein MN116_000782 [Schistosoma mekongi]|uniref:Uncharacterized protein n=1 Tax=Schistosoma mekongi TaxID=38744 RepID=A0AAE1ZJK3_SCHME|nr:hypothetical protein MN116_000782 [Schistosoma mekongi]